MPSPLAGSLVNVINSSPAAKLKMAQVSQFATSARERASLKLAMVRDAASSSNQCVPSLDGASVRSNRYVSISLIGAPVFVSEYPATIRSEIRL